MTGGYPPADTTPSSEYKRQLRAQCIDQHGRHRHQHAGPPVYHGGPSHSPRTFRHHEEDRSQKDRPTQGPGRPLVEYSRAGLYRSNSSLELDCGGGSGVEPVLSASGVLCRDYGSVNSLDKVDCFSTMLRNYRQSIDDLNADAGKPSVKRREKYASQSGVRSFVDTPSRSSTAVDSCAVFNGFLQPSDDVTNAATSPKSKSQKSKDRKARSESGSSGGSLFRKLRGVKSDPYSGAEQLDSLSSSTSDSNPKLEDRIRRKAFSHYDCQSIGVNLTDVVRRRAGSGSSEASLQVKRTNTSTGASAASSGGVVELAGPSDVDDQQDLGDGKNNELIESCSHFRNEVGGEDERTVALTRGVAERHGRHHSKDLVNSPVCSGVAVLDCSPASNGTPEPPLLLHNNLILEYVDQGAFYYRRFFYDYGTQFQCICTYLFNDL